MVKGENVCVHGFVRELLENEKAYQGTKHRFGISVFQRLLVTNSVFIIFTYGLDHVLDS